MFEIISSIFKYAFTIVIYIFIFNIIRLIILDIRSMNEKSNSPGMYKFSLKLLGVRGVQDFKIEESYVLEGDTSIGRSHESEISIEDSFLSSTHATLVKKKNDFYLKDMGSTNGTLLNEKRIGSKPLRLKDGDKVSLGRIDFLYVKEKRKGGQ